MLKITENEKAKNEATVEEIIKNLAGYADAGRIDDNARDLYLDAYGKLNAMRDIFGMDNLPARFGTANLLMINVRAMVLNAA